jgi:hypothetical protein
MPLPAEIRLVGDQSEDGGARTAESVATTRTSLSCCDHVVTVQPSPATNARTPAYRRTFSSRKIEKGSWRARPARCVCCSGDMVPVSFHCSNRVSRVVTQSQETFLLQSIIYTISVRRVCFNVAGRQPRPSERLPGDKKPCDRIWTNTIPRRTGVHATDRHR